MTTTTRTHLTPQAIPAYSRARPKKGEKKESSAQIGISFFFQTARFFDGNVPVPFLWLFCQCRILWQCLKIFPLPAGAFLSTRDSFLSANKFHFLQI